MKKCILFGICLFIGFQMHAQSIAYLRSKKESNKAQIKHINELLEQAGRKEKASLNLLNLLNEQIRLQNELIEVYSNEITAIQGFIADNDFVVKSLELDLEGLKNEYSQMIRFAQKNKNSYDKILFLLSAESFNQAYKRILYLQQYTEYRRKQAKLIVDLRQLLALKVKDLDRRRKERIHLLAQRKNEAEELESKRTKYDEYVQYLQGRQKKLKERLRQEKSMAEDLNREIEHWVADESGKAREKGISGFMLTPEQKRISDDLLAAKGKLKWPVEKGVIVERFGVHAHPILKKIKVKNNGIDISGSEGMKVKAVFRGEVSKVFGIAGGNMAIILRHGSYLSVYSNLQEVLVKPGDKITIGQEIGTVYTDTNDGHKTILKFQIWKESQKLNPEDWLKN